MFDGAVCVCVHSANNNNNEIGKRSADFLCIAASAYCGREKQLNQQQQQQTNTSSNGTIGNTAAAAEAEEKKKSQEIGGVPAFNVCTFFLSTALLVLFVYYNGYKHKQYLHDRNIIVRVRIIGNLFVCSCARVCGFAHKHRVLYSI